MKKILLILVVLGIGAAIAYVLGTDSGRARRDDLMARARKSTDDLDIDLTDDASTRDDFAAASSS
jgi:hypothetical protein